MKNSTLLQIGAVALWCGVAAGQESDRKIIDLTYTFSERTVYWPTADGFKLRVDAAGVNDQGFYYAANSFCGAEHGGTHIDAPIHFAESKPTVDEIDLRRLIAPGIVIDVRQKTMDNPDYQVTVEDLRGWEEHHGRIPDGNIVLLRTGWGRFYPDLRKYLGTSERGPEAVPNLRFPGLDPSAARWLTEERDIAAIGLDTASIDPGQSSEFMSHRILFESGIPAFENVASLEQLPATGFQVIALPMKIAHGSGGPLRIVAVLN